MHEVYQFWQKVFRISLLREKCCMFSGWNNDIKVRWVTAEGLWFFFFAILGRPENVQTDTTGIFYNLVVSLSFQFLSSFHSPPVFPYQSCPRITTVLLILRNKAMPFMQGCSFQHPLWLLFTFSSDLCSSEVKQNFRQSPGEVNSAFTKLKAGLVREFEGGKAKLYYLFEITSTNGTIKAEKYKISFGRVKSARMEI